MGGFGKMMPKWKVRREIDRLRQQLKAVLTYPFEPFLKRTYDKSFFSRIRQTLGSKEVGKKTAIFLLYQPNGLVDSTIETCRHLNSNGYSILAISNSPLRPNDRDKLVPFCWNIVERPNYGYDFGGYRDGVRIISELKPELQSLIIINDSIWFPIFDDDNIISRMETCGDDVVGTVMQYPKRHALAFWKNAAPFLESYFFYFGSRALGSEAFKGFWPAYRLSSIKYNAVHRGERRLTDAMAIGGLSTRGLFTRAGILAGFEAADIDWQVKSLEHAAYVDPKFAEASEKLLSNPKKDAKWSKDALVFVEKMTSKRGFHAAFTFASIRFLGATFLKKAPAQSKESIQHVMRQKILDAIVAGDLPTPLPGVASEIDRSQREGAAAVGR